MEATERDEILRKEAERDEKIRRRMEREERRRERKMKKRSLNDDEDHDRRIGTYHGRVWEMRPPYLAGAQWPGAHVGGGQAWFHARHGAPG